MYVHINIRIPSHLQILEEVIKFRWGALPDEQREGIKTYISNLIIKLCTDDASFRTQRAFLNKMNIVLVQVATRSNDVSHIWQKDYVSRLTMWPWSADPQAGLAAQVEDVHP